MTFPFLSHKAMCTFIRNNNCCYRNQNFHKPGFNPGFFFANSIFSSTLFLLFCPLMLLASSIIMGMIYGVLIELITTVLFKAEPV